MCITEDLLKFRKLLSHQLVDRYTNKAKQSLADFDANSVLFAKKKKDAINDSIKKTEKQSGASSSGGDPNDPDDDFFEKLKKRADKKDRSLKFGMMYRDPLTGLWWSKDIGGQNGHSGFHYKVFKAAARGFEWLFDANTIGEMIIEKHKGPIGRFIPYSEVVFL